MDLSYYSNGTACVAIGWYCLSCVQRIKMFLGYHENVHCSLFEWVLQLLTGPLGFKE